MTDPRPLVLTLEVDEQAQARFDRERGELFPSGRTAVGAHVTLFHALPAAAGPGVGDDLTAAVRRTPFEVEVTAVVSLGRGVAYALVSADLARLHSSLQQAWYTHLTRQDRQRLWPHVTVQNKVPAAQARATLLRLQESFRPFAVSATALRLWRYDGGPWTLLRRFPFQACREGADP